MSSAIEEITGIDLSGDFLSQIAGNAEREAELLTLLRMEDWLTDLHKFSVECLGNGPQTAEGLAFNLEPRVAAYTKWVGQRVLQWLEDRKAGTVKSRRKIMVLVPRECGKTTNITTTLPVWLQCHDPNVSVVIDAAKVRNMADKMLGVVKEHMMGNRGTSMLHETFGEDFYNPKRAWNDTVIVSGHRVDMARKDPTVMATSVEIGMTGGHPDVWIWDDPVTRELANDSWYKTCWDHYLGTFPIVSVNGLFILVMTRYGDGDPCGRIIQEEIAPATVKALGELPDDFRNNWHTYAHYAGWDVWLDHGRNPDDPDELYYPSIWTPERIREYENVSPAEFAAQVMNMPGRREDQPLKEEHVERLWIDFEDVPPEVWNNIYIHMDLAWKDSKAYKEGRGDWTVIQVWGDDNEGRSYYLPMAYRGRHMQHQFKDYWLTIMQQLIAKRAVVRLMTYDKPKGGMGDSVAAWFRDTAVKAGFPCPPINEMSRPGQDIKDDRCMLASRYWIDGTVRLVRHAPEVNVLVDEMLGIGTTRFDDMRDAAADHFHSEVRIPRARSLGFTAGHDGNKPWEKYFSGRQDEHTLTFGGELPLNPKTPLEVRKWQT